MDTSQFGQEAGGDDIFFDEQLSDDDSDSNPEEQGNVAKGNLNRHNNVNTNYMDDITDSDEDGTEEDE
jgi:hypothetical protein